MVNPRRLRYPSCFAKLSAAASLSSVTFRSTISPLNLDKLSKDIFPTNKILIKTKNQKVYTTFEDNQLQKPLCYLVENKILHKDLDALIATQKKEKRVLEFNDEIAKLQNNQNYNEIFFKSGVTLRSSLIVGLDGANSLIRELSGIKSKNYGIKKYGLVGLIEHEMRHPFTSWQVFSKNGILALLAKENKSKNRSVSSMIWSLDKEQMNYLLNLETKDFEKQIENEKQNAPDQDDGDEGGQFA